MTNPPFHLAFPVHDIDAARAFYGGLLGCPVGRSDRGWIDFNFFGHQIVAHLTEGMETRPHNNRVDGQDVPIPHFGAVLPIAQWQALADRLIAAGTDFVMEPNVRFRNEPGEQATMFFLDPSGNALELKAMRDHTKLYSAD